MESNKLVTIEIALRLNGVNEPKVQLDSRPLDNLLEDAIKGHRVYELMLITRPGDLLDYIRVTTFSFPAAFERQLKHSRRFCEEDADLTLKQFDSSIDQGWDCDEIGMEWIRVKASSEMQTFLTTLLDKTREVQATLENGPPLTRAILDSIKEKGHAFDCLDRKAAIAESNYWPRNPPGQTIEFYQQLEKLLSDPKTQSVAYRADGDYTTLRYLAQEQITRAKRGNKRPRDAMRVSVSASLLEASNGAWGSEIDFYQEGSGTGELYISGTGMRQAPLMSAIRKGEQRDEIVQKALTCDDYGEVPGYDRTYGDGWFLYVRNDRVDSSILTSTGKWFDVLNPNPELIDLNDIAAALSKLCRFGGHCRSFYSVAEHSVLVARLCLEDDPGNKLSAAWALLHDASEAYMVDISRPIKSQLPEYIRIEEKIQEAVAKRFGLPWPIPQVVHHADRTMLKAELRAYMPNQAEFGDAQSAALPEGVVLLDKPLVPIEAEAAFLECANSLDIGRK